MSLHEYRASSELSRLGFPFYSLIMEAMRRADNTNAARLRACFPAVWDELKARYNAPGGIIDGDVLPEDDDSEPSDIGIPDDLESAPSKVIDLMEALKASLKPAG